MTGALAILCSGQGGQHATMFDLLADRSEADTIFEAATPLLGADPRDFVKTASETALFSNRAGQILCCTQALALHATLAPTLDGQTLLCAGYSVGELAAWGIAGCLSPEQVLTLAARRADLMNTASPPDAGLAGIAGLPMARLDPILHKTGTTIAIANGPESAVIGGLHAALDAAILLALEAGATTARRLPVAVPSHTPLLQSAVVPLREALTALRPSRPACGRRLISGLDGEPVFDMIDGCDRLAKQVGMTVHWNACLEACAESTVSAILETGPGCALSRMAHASLASIPTRSADDFHTLDGLIHWLTHHG
ncbi:acyltransferase domain-containing protein [Acetobacter vaccinii]|uniref:Acyltransferase domain-containing protein n=1 Tax=Acetobacter vaccinii TaxID=2592655 RepID=A0A5C1YRE2_9PROT|nr:acyltransferase domain-containing protein [Acetobacter vaccinii]QEO18215.1 acyltransferase domain-containing protein [Acetobacter vaccinii]